MIRDRAGVLVICLAYSCGNAFTPRLWCVIRPVSRLILHSAASFSQVCARSYIRLRGVAAASLWLSHGWLKSDDIVHFCGARGIRRARVPLYTCKPIGNIGATGATKRCTRHRLIMDDGEDMDVSVDGVTGKRAVILRCSVHRRCC